MESWRVKSIRRGGGGLAGVLGLLALVLHALEAVLAHPREDLGLLELVIAIVRVVGLTAVCARHPGGVVVATRVAPGARRLRGSQHG